jgi:hypothetical protein
MTTKIFKILHSILGIIPFLWFLAFLMIILLGTIKLGYVPKYGNIIDPYALKIGAITKAHFFLGISALLAFYIWLVMSAIFFFIKGFSFNKITTILFFVGVIGYLTFKYLFPNVFAWVMD